MTTIRINQGGTSIVINPKMLAWYEYDSGLDTNEGKLTLHFSGQSSKTFEGDVAHQIWKKLDSMISVQN